MHTKEQEIKAHEVAQEIYRQIKATFNINVIWSWGMEKIQALTYREMPSLTFKVNGFNHKGWVVISLNGGKDLYNIYLLDHLQNLKQIILDLFCEDLKILDTLIETGDMSEREYKEKVKNTVIYL